MDGSVWIGMRCAERPFHDLNEIESSVGRTDIIRRIYTWYRLASTKDTDYEDLI